MDPLVWEVRPPQVPVFDDEKQAVVGEQRVVVVDRAVVPVEVNREPGDALGEDLQQVADRAARDDREVFSPSSSAATAASVTSRTSSTDSAVMGAWEGVGGRGGRGIRRANYRRCVQSHVVSSTSLMWATSWSDVCVDILESGVLARPQPPGL